MIQTFGLAEKDIQAIRTVFAKYPAVEKVLLYGSRAMGNFKNGSDIDLVLVGPEKLNLNIQYKIMEDIDELMLPYLFDISIFHKISDPSVIDHINRVGVVFYESK